MRIYLFIISDSYIPLFHLLIVNIFAIFFGENLFVSIFSASAVVQRFVRRSVVGALLSALLRTTLRALLLLIATVRPKLFTHLLHTKQELKHREAAHQEDDEYGQYDENKKKFEHK